MNTREIRQHIERSARSKRAVSSSFRCCHLESSQEIQVVTDPRYLPPLADLIFDLKPERLLTIGALYGTLESYILQCYPRFLAEITVCDLDIAAYNPARDNGSYIYRNICGTNYGGFDREFVLIRGDSKWPGCQRKVKNCGPYDLVFVDGEHTAEAVYSDMTLASECLAPNGTILVHDINLFGSSVPAGWLRWAKEHPEWRCDGIDEPHFMLGLGIARRLSDE